MTSEVFFKFIFPPICLAIGFLGQRILRKDSLSESLARTRQLLDISKELKGQNLTVEEIHELQYKLLKRRESLTIRTDDDKNLTPLPNDGNTQYEMNIISAENFEKANADMRIIVAKLETSLDDPERCKLLHSAQKNWELFRENQAHMVSSIYKEGTIYSLIHASELEMLTLERTAQLKRILRAEKMEG